MKMSARTHSHNHSHTKKEKSSTRGGARGFREYEEVECDSAAEGSRDENRTGGERWEPILPTCGSRSACPPLAERTRP